jgi:DNA polymerase-3 subunit beta
MPILSHVLFRVANDKCEVVASDLEVQLSCAVSLEEGSDFSNDVTIPGRKLFDIGKGLPDESILEIKILKKKARFKSSQRKVNLYFLL